MAEKQSSYRRGFLVWSAEGYVLAEAPPFDALSSTSPRSDDHWRSLISIIEHAKHGDFSYTQGLYRWIEQPPEEFFDRLCIMTLGDLGTEDDLQFLLETFSGADEDVQAYLSEAAACSGRLMFVEAMLSAWRNTRGIGNRETIGYSICDLLTHGDDDLTSVVGLTPKWNSTKVMEGYSKQFGPNPNLREDPSPFEIGVLAQLDELLSKLPQETCVVYGEPFDAIKLAGEMISYAETRASVSWIYLRHRFEAATGVPCNKFFENGQFCQLGALTLLDEFLNSNVELPVGYRLFWGNTIPAS